MVAINDGDGWVDVTRPETTDIALGGNETDFPGKFFRELASRDKFVYDRTGRNKIINGNFDVWQRGTSFNLFQYTADRWVNSLFGSSASTVTRQNFTLGQTDVPGNPSHYYRATVTSGGTASSGVLVQQRIEDVRTFQGQTVTVSFWAKADATKPVSVELEQNFGIGGSPSATVNSIGVTKFNLTTSWAKYTATVSIPSISGKTLGSNSNDHLTFNIWFEGGSDYNSRTDSLGLQSGTFDIAQVQIEEGSTATKFEFRSLGEELALCQRYYETLPVARVTGTLYTPNGDIRGSVCSYRVSKRATPTITYTATNTDVIALGYNSEVANVSLGTLTFVAFGTDSLAFGGASNYTAFASLGTVVTWGGIDIIVYIDAEL